MAGNGVTKEAMMNRAVYKVMLSCVCVCVWPVGSICKHWLQDVHNRLTTFIDLEATK